MIEKVDRRREREVEKIGAKKSKVQEGR